MADTDCMGLPTLHLIPYKFENTYKPNRFLIEITNVMDLHIESCDEPYEYIRSVLHKHDTLMEFIQDVFYGCCEGLNKEMKEILWLDNISNSHNQDGFRWLMNYLFNEMQENYKDEWMEKHPDGI
jgi:hypothetical protein